MNHPPIRASADREFRRVAERERDEARELLQANVEAKWQLLDECQELHRKLAEARKWSRRWKECAKHHRFWARWYRTQYRGYASAVKTLHHWHTSAESAARSWRTVALVTLAVLVGYVVVVGIVAVLQ